MKTINKLTLALLLMVSFNCNDLEEEVYSDFLSQNFFQTEEQFQTQGLGLYNTFNHVIWEWWMMDFLIYPSKYAVTRQGGDVWWKKTVYGALETAHANRYANVWSIAYRCIGRANTIIKYAETSPLMESNPELVQNHIAEARWFRAYAYFNLVQMFGDVPIYDEPIETPEQELLFQGRMPKEEVYDLILEDLNYASEFLPVSWDNLPPGRVTKATGTMLLGKVYLTTAGLPLNRTENYNLAIEVLKPLADNPGDYNVELLSNWKSIFDKDNEGNKEILFALNNTYENLYGGVLPHFTNPLFSGFASNNGRPAYNLAWSYDLYQLYEDDDIRKQEGFTMTYTDIRNGNEITYDPLPLNPPANQYKGRNGICGTKYQDPTPIGNVIHEKDVIIYRYADVFLMLSEAYMEMNMIPEAQNYLNIVRSRVNASNVEEADQQNLRQIIRDERMRELYNEYSELYDMRRWGTAEENYMEHPVRLRRAPNRPWEDKFLLCPIPDIELSANPNLTQNPGW